MPPLIVNALTYGVILSAVLFSLILVVVRINPEIMLNDYPPDIRAKYGPMSERAKRQRIPVAIVTLVLLVAIVARSFQELRAITGGDIPFQAAFLHSLVMFSVFNVLDWLLLDWLIVVTLRPRFMVLPGTEGLAGYSDYWFHFRGFLIGCVIVFFASLLVGAVVAALF
jgi:hypothetical protein